MRVDELETPVPVVDLGIMEANIKRLQADLDQHGIAIRPHIQTHKVPVIAQNKSMPTQAISLQHVFSTAG